MCLQHMAGEVVVVFPSKPVAGASPSHSSVWFLAFLVLKSAFFSPQSSLHTARIIAQETFLLIFDRDK